jgi:hypothetical protein
MHTGTAVTLALYAPTLAINPDVPCLAERWGSHATGDTDHARSGGTDISPIFTLDAAFPQDARPWFLGAGDICDPINVHRSTVGVATLTECTDTPGLHEGREGRAPRDGHHARAMGSRAGVEVILDTPSAEDPCTGINQPKRRAFDFAANPLHPGPPQTSGVTAPPADDSRPLVRAADTDYPRSAPGMLHGDIAVPSDADDRVERGCWPSQPAPLGTDPEDCIPIEVDIAFRWPLGDQVCRLLGRCNHSCLDVVATCHRCTSELL